MSQINQYPLEATVINDEDWYDVDFWNGLAYESRKISGANLKAILSGAEALDDLTDVETGLPLTPTNADDGRVLYYDIDTNKWISDDIANIANVVKDCKTTTGNTIPKGTPVALTGFDNDLLVVEPADASDPNLMPAIGVAAETIDDTNAKKLVSFGKIQGVDTSAFIDGDILYVAIGGGFTTTRPTGATTEIQRVATVLKSDNPGGQLKVFNTSRSAGLPNLSTGKIWVGDADGYPTEQFVPVNTDTNIGNSDLTLSNPRLLLTAGNNFIIQDNGSTDGHRIELTNFLAKLAWDLSLAAGDQNSVYCAATLICIEAANATIPVKVVTDLFSLGNKTSGHEAGINTNLLTVDRDYELPDQSGTIALLSDITTAAEKFIHQSYAYDMSPAAAYTWNGLTVGATAITTLNESYRAQDFVGTGQPDGCFINFTLPTYYPANTDIKVTVNFSTNGTGGDVRFYIGLQSPNAANLGTDADTEWKNFTFTATAGLPAGKNTLIFSGAGLLASLPMALKIYRDPGDAADTYGGDAFITNLEIEIV